MDSSALRVSQQSATPCATGAVRPPLSGTWAVRAGQALSLRPAWAGVLEVARGRVWLTVSGPGGKGAGCDEVLEAGARRLLRPGQHAVLEPWHSPQSAEPVALRWDALTVWQADALADPSPARAATAADVHQAWQALVQAVVALRAPAAALWQGLVAYGLWHLRYRERHTQTQGVPRACDGL
ncbi:MAG: DUF2917 domain-containing protein [Burkholderiaceae bacterium]